MSFNTVPGEKWSCGSDSNGANVSLNWVLIQFERTPIISGGRVLVPVRDLSEAFGATVNWYKKTESVVITYQDMTLTLRTKGTKAVIDRKMMEMGVPAICNNGRIFVPIRFLAHVFGADVDWDGKTKTVIITHTNT